MHLAGEARASRALWPAFRPARQIGGCPHHHVGEDPSPSALSQVSQANFATLLRSQKCFGHAQVKKLQAPQKQLEAARKPKKPLSPNAAKPARPPRKPKQADAGQNPVDALRLKVADSRCAIAHPLAGS